MFLRNKGVWFYTPDLYRGDSFLHSAPQQVHNATGGKQEFNTEHTNYCDWCILTPINQHNLNAIVGDILTISSASINFHWQKHFYLLVLHKQTSWHFGCRNSRFITGSILDMCNVQLNSYLHWPLQRSTPSTTISSCSPLSKSAFCLRVIWKYGTITSQTKRL